MGGDGGVTGFLEDSTGLNLSNNSSSDRAVAGQQAAASAANGVAGQIYDQTRSDVAPWQQAGASAIGQMASPEYMKDFTMADFQADPGYQFRMAEGLKAINNSAAAKGGRLGGATMKALAGYSGNLASGEYQNAYDRYNTNQNQRFGRLATISGAGQTATGQSSGAGQAYSSTYGQNVTGAANASAAQAMGQAQQTSGLIGQGMTAAGLIKFCDERLKKNIRAISKTDIEEMQSHLKPCVFDYIDPRYGGDNSVGVMAQDLEKSKLGRTLVFEDAAGNKQIDVAGVMLLLLTTLGKAA